MITRSNPRFAAATLATALILTAAATACGTPDGDAGAFDTRPPIAADLGTADPGEVFHQIEEALLPSAGRRIEFQITAEGALAAEFEGELELRGSDRIAPTAVDSAAPADRDPAPGAESGRTAPAGTHHARLTAEGTFASDSVALFLRASDGRLVGGNRPGGERVGGGERAAGGDSAPSPAFDQPTPPHLREALVIGLTRMGLLHNLARLTAGSPPDRADGSVRSWVEARDFAWTTRDHATDSLGISFGILVGGQPTADATLWLDPGGWPVARDQTVRFPGGEMRVREWYDIR